MAEHESKIETIGGLIGDLELGKDRAISKKMAKENQNLSLQVANKFPLKRKLSVADHVNLLATNRSRTKSSRRGSFDSAQSGIHKDIAFEDVDHANEKKVDGKIKEITSLLDGFLDKR